MTKPDQRTNRPAPLLVRVVGASLAAIGECVGLTGVYLTSRPWFLLPVALPAVLGLGLALSAAVWVWAVPDHRIVSSLRTALREAVIAKDLATQRICLQALLAKEPDSQEHRLAFALLYREEGDTASATALLKELAPADSVGYAPAHRQLAEDALRQYENAAPGEDRQALPSTALHHLKSSGRLDDPRLEYMLGVLYADDGDLALAELHLQQAATQGYGVAHLSLSQLERQRGNLAAAERHRQDGRKSLQDYVREHPDDREARLGWARCLLDGGEWSVLEPLLAKLRDDPGSGRFRDRLGQLHLTAAQQHPLRTPAMVQTAVDYTRDAFDLMGDPSPAAWQLIQFARVPGTVPRELLGRIQQWQRVAAGKQPSDSRFELIAGGVAEALGDQAAAEAGFQAAAKAAPRALSELASYYRRQRNREKLAQTNAAIVQHFEPIARERPDDSTTIIVLAQAYAGQQRWPEARKIVAEAANKPAARAVMAGLFVEEFDALAASRQPPSKPVSEERPVFDHATSSADLADAELLRLALLAVSDYPPALHRWEAKVIEEAKAGGNRQADFVTELLTQGQWPATMHYLLGMRAFELRDWTRAIEHWEQTRRLRPKDVAVLSRLATALLQSPHGDVRLAEAVSLVQAALDRAPDQPALLALRGRIRARQRDDVSAVADLEAALARLPEQPELHGILADCYERLGNNELSQRHRGLARPSQPANAIPAKARQTGEP